MTLIEVVLAMAILSIIAVPMLKIYVSSTKSTMISQEIADAQFIAQVQLENLVNVDYIELLTGGYATTDFTNSSYNNDYDYTLELVPWGLDYDTIIASGETVSYMQVIPYQEMVGGVAQTNLVAFLPDGEVIQATDIGSTITMDEPTSGNYYFCVTNATNGVVTDASGSISTDKLVTIGNTTMIKASDTITFDFDPVAKIVFVTTAISPNYSFTGTYTNQLLEYLGTDEFLNFLVRATVKVYRADDHTKPIAEMTNTLYPTFVLD